MLMNRTKKWAAASALLCSSSLLAQSAYALPSLTRSNDVLVALQRAAGDDPRLEGVDFFLDANDGSKTIYVTPANQKFEAAGYQMLGSPACEVLEGQYALTYDMPETDDLIAAAQAGPGSPYFDLHFANYVRNRALIKLLYEKTVEQIALRETYAAEYRAYTETKAVHEGIKADLARVRGALQELDGALNMAYSQLAAARTIEEIDLARLQTEAADQRRHDEAPPLREREYALFLEELQARRAFITAESAWSVHELDDNQLQRAITGLTLSFSAMQSVAEDAFSRSERLLGSMENTVVARTSASYTIFDGEATAVRAILAEVEGADDYTAIEVPVFNVELQPISSANHWSRLEGDGAGEADASDRAAASAAANRPAPPSGDSTPTSASSGVDSVARDLGFSTTVTRTADGTAATGTTETPAETPVTDEDQRPVPFVDRKPPADRGAGTYEQLLTRGVHCTGSPGRTGEQILEVDVPDGSIRAVEFTRYAYRARAGNLLQTVALSYDFYVDAEPLGARCEMDLQRVFNYHRDRGSKGWFFSKKSWDNVRRSQTQDSGVSCTVTSSPSALFSSPEDAAKYVDDLKQTAMQEMMAEFLSYYAKRYEVKLIDDAAPPSNPSALTTASTALPGICGTHKACLVTGLVMKTAEEMFGRTAGATSMRDHFSGRIKRDYNIDTYRKLRRNARIDLVVVD
jgi:hypothetical protein